MSEDLPPDKKSKTPDSEDSSRDDTVDQLKEELGKASEKVEKMEEKIEEQEKKSASFKNYKSEGLTLGLSIGIGIMGIMGVGHMYVGRVKRGIAILILGFVAEFAIFFSIGFLGIPLGYASTWDSAGPMVAVMGLAAIGGLAFYIWQILNSRKLCREYNEYFEEYGKPPW